MEGWITNLAGIFSGYQYQRGPIHVEIQKGKIVTIQEEYPNKSQLDGTGLILSPGFVDGHTHLIFGGSRFQELSLKLEGKSYSEILARGGGIQSTVQATRQTPFRELAQLVKMRCDVMLSHGTTHLEAKSGYGLETKKEIELLEVLHSVDVDHDIDIFPTFGAAHVFPNEITPEEYIDSIIYDMLPEIIKRKLASATDVFCDKGAFNVDQTMDILSAASEKGHGLKVHADELMYTGIGGIASTQFDLLSADHLLQAKYEDFETLRKNNTVAMFMPMAPFGLFTNDLPQGYKESNVIIGLGSDFNPNNWAVSMQSAIRYAVYRYKLTPIEAMCAATSGSYLGITGQPLPPIKQGAKANFILLQANSLEELSSKFGQNLVRKVFKDGEPIVNNSHLIS